MCPLGIMLVGMFYLLENEAHFIIFSRNVNQPMPDHEMVLAFNYDLAQKWEACCALRKRLTSNGESKTVPQTQETF